MSLTIGVWGANHPHAGGHFAALNNAERISKLLIWDEDPSRAQAAAAGSSKAEVVEDIVPLVEKRAVDALVVLLPNRDAGPATLKAIEAGLYVYGDKPGARTAAEMRQIVAAADDTGAHFSPCYPWRVDPIANEIKRLIDDGILGEMWAFEAKWITSQVALRGPESWLFHDEMAGGGILAWLGCHWIDLLHYLLGPATDVAAMVSTQCPEDIDVEDTASVILKLESGAIGTVRAGYAHKPFAGYDDQDTSFSFEGSLGSIYWPTTRREGYRLRTGHSDYAGISRRWINVEHDVDPKAAGYSADLLEAFLTCVEDRTAPPATERDALYVLEVLEAAYQSSREGAHVSLRE